jgi:hypothetical protein
MDVGAWLGPKQVTGPTRAELALRTRRDCSIHFYEGLNGAGKSWWMVRDTIPDLDAGIPVLSTVRLLDFRNPRPCEDPECGCDKTDPERHGHAHPAYRRWSTWGQLLDLVQERRPCAVLADEVTGVADATEGASLPAQVKVFVPQLRRADGVFRLTGISWSRAHKSVRQITQAVTRCTSDWPIRVYHEDGTARLHRARRLTIAKTYSALSLNADTPTDAMYASVTPAARESAWIPGSEAGSAYDTFDPVDVIGTVTESGRCAYCDGMRQAPRCTCSDYVERQAAERGTARSARSAEDRPPRPSRALHVIDQEHHDHAIPASSGVTRRGW